VDNHSSGSIPNSSYNSFLYAGVCEQRNGTQLSVLSALARVNVDPWEEAARLAAMPRAVAELTLASTFGQLFGNEWTSSEAQAASARLIQLLPQRNNSSRQFASVDSESERVDRSMLWIFWVGVAITISLLSPRHHATTTPDVSISASKSDVQSPLTDDNTSLSKSE
jgi:hypothetical protein